MSNEIIAREEVDVRRAGALTTVLKLRTSVFADAGAMLVLDASDITATIHTTEERLLAVAEMLQRVVAEARAKREAAQQPPAQPLRLVTDEEAIAQHDAEERLEGTTP